MYAWNGRPEGDRVTGLGEATSVEVLSGLNVGQSVWNGHPEGNGVTGLGEETLLGGPSDCLSVDSGNGP